MFYISLCVILIIWILWRFYKLHERKCEPIIMTVPRKVSLCSYQDANTLLFPCCFIDVLSAFYTVLLSWQHLPCPLHPSSRICSRTTCIPTRPAPIPPWRRRSGSPERTEAPSWSRSKTATSPRRTGIWKWSRPTCWRPNQPRRQKPSQLSRSTLLHSPQ